MDKPNTIYGALALLKEATDQIAVHLNRQEGEKSPDERLVECFAAAFRDLSEEQQDRVADLVQDIAGGEVRPLDSSERDAARRALMAFEAGAAQLTDEEVIDEINGRQWMVSIPAGSRDEGIFMVSMTWTGKGLRSFLARLKLMESVQFPEGDEAWEGER